MDVGLGTVGAVLLLVHLYRAEPEQHSLRTVFLVPAFCLYLQLGILLVKGIVVAWRTPLPTSQTFEHMKVRESMRKYYLLRCDWTRIAATAGIAFWAVSLSVPKAAFEMLLSICLGVWFALTLAEVVWTEIRRKQLADMRVMTLPLRLPDLIGQSDMTRWPMCYRPQVPMLVLKGVRGYSLNLANTVTYLGAAYLIGMIFLVMLARVGR